MIPVRLQFEGLYSYQKMQEIDFSELTETGLFGVFGTVGSGKSSILEAITFALYGETERMNSKEKRAYNMMNLRSNRCYMEFDFINFEDKTFRIVREYNRNPKKFDTITTKTHILYENVNGKWIPQDSTSLEEVIGLKYENFKRTIIIPQGQFKEFLDLKPTERTSMMKEIFGLQQYDLRDNVARLERVNNSNLDQLSGQLIGFEAVSEQEIEDKKSALENANVVYTAVQAEKKDADERFQIQKAIKSDIDLLAIKLIEFGQLNEKQPLMTEKTKELEQYEHFQKVFQNDLLNEARLIQEISETSSKQRQALLVLQGIEKEKKNIEEKLALLQVGFDQLPITREEENDYKCFIILKTLTDELLILKNRTDQGNLLIAADQKRELGEREKLLKLQLEMDELRKKQFGSDMILSIQNWFNESGILENDFQQLANLQKENELEKVSLTSEMEQLGMLFPDYRQTFRVEEERLVKEKQDLDKRKSQLEVQQQLAKYVHNLHEGDACPLCGSETHPSPADHKSDTEQLIEIEECLRLNQDKLIELVAQNVKREEVAQKFEKNGLLEKQLSTNKNKLDEKKIALEQQFIWDKHLFADKSSFEVQLNQHRTQEKLFREKSEEERRMHDEIAKIQGDLLRFKEKIQQLLNEQIRKTNEHEMILSQVRRLDWNAFLNFDLQELEAKQRESEAHITRVESAYNKATVEFQQLQISLAGQEANVKALQEQLQERQQKQTEVYSTIAEKLEKEDGVTRVLVEEVLAKKLNIALLRSEIQEFNISIETVRNAIEELKARCENKVFVEKEFQELNQKVIDLEEKLKEATEQVATLQADLKRITDAYEQKKELLKKADELKTRGDNLKVIHNLFKGAGFVEYVAQIYLKQLCAHANVRFHRMTRNQLSLEMNNNQFEIVDYLNEGKTRSVKTLSGGQAFQVSLCLALALAESVQSNSKANRNFFFIDEGFGTQDAESVNVVFETLMSLQKENRIVGIISHVEELKERMPIALQIEKHPETGSFIQVVR